jgi:hypothetical protein
MTQKLITMALAIVILALVFYSGRQAGVASGKTEATIEYNKKIDEYKTALDNQTEVLNKALSIESVNLTKEVGSLLKDTQAIKQQLKNQPQPLVVVQNGECLPGPLVLDARRKMIERVNQ